MIIEIVLFLTVILLLTMYSRNPSDLPPGKWGFPVIGYLPSKGEKTSDVAKRLNAECGKVFCFKMGARLFVFLADFAVIKSYLGKAEFAGRFDFYSWRLYHYFQNAGIVLSEGNMWSTNRKFALRVLTEFGMGKSRLEHTINVEVESVVKEFERKVGTQFEIDYSLNIAVLNVTWSLIADKRFDVNDMEISIFQKLIGDIIASFEGPSRILSIYPWLIPFIPRFVARILKVDQCEENRDKFTTYFKMIIEEHQKTLDKNNPRDYIDMYLIEMEEQKDINLSRYSQDYSNLIASLFDLYVAGSETTASSIRWYVLYMMKYPEVQKKIQEEIDSVVPKERYPSLEDKEKLPYLEASVHESLRLASLAPIGVPHGALEDSQIEGFRIPRGTIIFPCIEICHRSSEYWERPNDFYPEHFINEEGKFYIRKQGFLPFSLGRRQCLGESLAKMELFLFVGAILQNFTISAPDGQSVNIEPEPIGNTIHYPRQFKVFLNKRNI